MATATEADTTGQADYEYSSSSGSSDSPFDASNVSTIYKRQLSVSSRPQDKSLPVFDLRNTEFAKAHFTNFNLTSFSNTDIKKRVAKQFEADDSRVFVVESKGRVEETLVQTWIILLPAYRCQNRKIVVIETLEALEQTHPTLWCAWLDRTSTAFDVKELLLRKLSWRSGALCLNNRVPRLDLTIEDLVPGQYCCKVQMIRSSGRNVNLIFKPKPNVSYTYMLDVDVTNTVQNMKTAFLTLFKDDLLVREILPGHVIHFFFHDTFLDDTTCLGMLLRGSKDETFVMHIAPVDAICVTLKYRIQRGKTRIPYFQQVSIQPNCSTSSLRTEAAKYLNVDPMAVKLTCDNKRIEEHDCLRDILSLKKGTIISVGVKKKKTLLLRHPETQQENSINLYMLETVQVLKREIGKTFDVDPLKISLQCRTTEMQDKNLLLNYPIKNNMELGMEIFHNRIMICIFVLFKRVRLNLVINNSRVTTVDDILLFCACKLQYRRQHSRSIFQQKCLHKNKTLYEEQVQSGSTLYIVHFDNSERQFGKLMTIYTVRPDGQINPRLGGVCDGVLLHASKKVQLMTEEGEDSLNEELPLPTGILVHESSPVVETLYKRTCESCRELRSVSRSSQALDTVARKIDKEKYLHRGRAVFQRRFDREQTRRKQLYLEEEDLSWRKSTEIAPSLRKSESIPDQKVIEAQVYNNQENSPVSFYLPTSTTEEQQTQQQHPVNREHPRQELFSYNPDTNSLFIPVDASTDTEDISAVEKDQPPSQKKPASLSRQAEFASYLEKGPIKCNEFGNDMVDLQAVRNSPNGLYSSVEDSTSDTNNSSSSHDKSTETTYDRNLDRFNQLSCQTSISRCPVLTDPRLFRSMMRSIYPAFRSMSYPPRQRYRTVGETDLDGEMAYIIQSNTYPQLALCPYGDNAELETAGITMYLLAFVARQIGKNWKQLARRLKVDELTLEGIEYEQKNLLETSIQSLIAWKRSKGIKASKQELLQALKDIGMESIVEKCEVKNQITYQTA